MTINRIKLIWIYHLARPKTSFVIHWLSPTVYHIFVNIKLIPLMNQNHETANITLIFH